MPSIIIFPRDSKTWTVTGINYPKGTGGDSIWLFVCLFVFESFAVETYETHTKQLTSLNYLNKQIHQSSGTAMPRRSHLTRGMAALTIYFVFSLLSTLTEEKSPHYPRMTFTDQGNDMFLFTFKFCCTRTSCSKYGSEAIMGIKANAYPGDVHTGVCLLTLVHNVLKASESNPGIQLGYKHHLSYHD